jgi:hypothetical protein
MSLEEAIAEAQRVVADATNDTDTARAAISSPDAT